LGGKADLSVLGFDAKVHQPVRLHVVGDGRRIFPQTVQVRTDAGLRFDQEGKEVVIDAVGEIGRDGPVLEIGAVQAVDKLLLQDGFMAFGLRFP
jgi:hypothetical protein